MIRACPACAGTWDSTDPREPVCHACDELGREAPKPAQPSRFFRELAFRRKIRARDRAVDALVALGEAPVAMPSTGGEILLVHRDTYVHRRGQWRLTRFGASGEPYGHTEANSFRDAVVEAARFWAADVAAAFDPITEIPRCIPSSPSAVSS